MIIQFDVDGVLADFDQGYRSAYFRRYGVMKGRAERWDDSTDSKVWEDIKRSPDFWRTLNPLASRAAMRDINQLQHLGHTVYFVSARVGVEPQRQTYEWLLAHGIDRPTVVVSSKKALFAEAAKVTHAIDDKFGNAYVVSLLGYVKSYLLDAPYNRLDHGIVGGRVMRIESLDAFLSEIYRDIAKEVRA
jgi:FMN phosphatase YigB (HAD superfamily)